MLFFEILSKITNQFVASIFFKKIFISLVFLISFLKSAKIINFLFLTTVFISALLISDILVYLIWGLERWIADPRAYTTMFLLCTFSAVCCIYSKDIKKKGLKSL